jgi:hypothetical protein
MRDGGTVVDRFVASRPNLDAADREMVLGWRDPVEGIFEIRRKDRDAIILLNLIDDLEYRTYSNMGPAVFRPLPRGGFVHARLDRMSAPPRARRTHAHVLVPSQWDGDEGFLPGARGDRSVVQAVSLASAATNREQCKR